MALTAEQIEMRKTGVSASEIAAIVGLSPWAGPGDVWSDKLGMKEPFSGNKHTRRGEVLEPALVLWTGLELEKIVLHNKETFRSKSDPLCLATPDGFLYADEPRESPRPVATIEVKSPDWRTAADWQNPKDCPDGCPKYYLVQAQWQAGVLGMQECIVSGLIGGELWTYRIPFNERLFSALLERAHNFWRYVEAREPPPFIVGQGTRWISEVYRSQGDEDLVEPPTEKLEDLRNAAETYLVAQEAKKRAELDLEASKGYLCSVIQAHAGLALPGFRTTWKQDRASRKVDWEKIAQVAMDKLAGIVSLEELDKWTTENTTMKPGARKFLIKREK